MMQDLYNIEETIQDFERFVGGKKYKTIYADPPWQFANRTGKMAPAHKRLNRYSTMKQDSTIPSSAKDASPSTATPSAPSRPVRSSSKSSDSYDNMRGFDPASEDDIDDNGMSRYMENNDDEGWD